MQDVHKRLKQVQLTENRKHSWKPIMKTEESKANFMNLWHLHSSNIFRPICVKCFKI